MEGYFRLAHHRCLFNDLTEQILIECFGRFIFVENALQFLEFIELLVTFILGELLFPLRAQGADPIVDLGRLCRVVRAV